MSKGYKQCLLP